MSYLITSNIASSDADESIIEGLNKPYSYFNNLQNTHLIPKNSEIAVQSVLINKDGRISINRGNNVFYFYYGTKLSSTLSSDEVTSHPIRMSIYADDQVDNSRQVNVDDFASMLNQSVRRSLLHPNLQPSSINSSSSVVSVRRNSSGLDFEGYKICITSNASSDNASHINQTWIPTTLNQNAIVIPNASSVSNTTTDPLLHCIGTQFPLSLTNGSVEFDLEDLGADKTIPDTWSVGLSRCIRSKDVNGNDAPTLESPLYFDQNAGAGGGGDTFYDYQVTCGLDNASNKIKIFQSRFDIFSDQLTMEEFDYRQSRTTGAGSYVDLNASDITKVRFTGTGERMKIEVFDKGTGAYTVLVNGTNASSVLNLKPINQCMWHLFPKMAVPNGRKITLLEMNGVPIDNYVYGGETAGLDDPKFRQTNQDWWALMTNLSRQHIYCKDVDERVMSRSGFIQAFSQTGLNLTGAIDFNYVFILAESELYKPTRFASTQKILGFSNRPILDTPTQQTGNEVCFISDEAPPFTSAGSVFVRLKNLTFNSQNFAKGSPSKIIYHIPRFDNSGNQVGNLFFEPSERMYLKLNNPNELYLNDIDVELVYSDEKLCTSLVGKTVVCFHIRRSEDPL